ncbi:MAG: BON domain-containing protein [Planctomycetes bacterium]|nr:BON domain-containing protein [Planctomycetota bacterium]
MRRVFVGLAVTLASFAPTWVRADDQQIAQQIVQELKAEQSAGKLRGFKIDLEVEEGTVLLTGRVSDAQQQKLALDVARRTAGVKQVVNDLRVADGHAKGGEKETPRFSLSRLNPKNLLGAHRDTRESSVSKTAAAKRPNAQPVERRAIEADAPLPVQVASANTTSEPAAAPRISDDQIAQQIFDRLQQYKQSGHLHGFRLDMKVEEGSVMLEGRVSQPEQKQLALEVARRVPGVYQVVDMIQIESATTAQVRPASTSDMSTRRRAASPEVAQVAPQPEPTPATPASPAPLQPTPAAPIPAAPQAQAGLPQAAPIPAHYGSMVGVAQVRYDHPQMPSYAWPSYAAYPNYAAVTYPRQYSPTAWPYIGPFYPYPQVPLGWRKVTLEWDDGWWQLDFKSR